MKMRLEYILSFFFALLCIAPLPASGFRYPNSFTLGIGVLSTGEITKGPYETSSAVHLFNERASPVVYAGYMFKAEKVFKIGIGLAWQQTGGTWYGDTYYVGNSKGYASGTYTMSSLTVALQGSLRYKKFRWGNIYTNAGIGVSSYFLNRQYEAVFVPQFGTRKRTTNQIPGAYYSPLGVTVGRRVAWFLEVGLGYKGLVNTGLVVNF